MAAMNSAFNSTKIPARQTMVNARKMALCTGFRLRMTFNADDTAIAARMMKIAMDAVIASP